MHSLSVSRRWIATHALSLVAVLIVAGSVFVAGVARHGGAKDIDARYLYAAAKCWSGGQSPYVSQVFSSTYQGIFGVAPVSRFFAYPPTVTLIALPLALFPWHLAAGLFSLANFAAAMVLFWACYRLVREELGHPLHWSHWFWVVLASTVSGIAGTIFTGQTSVFIAAAVAMAVVGSRCQRSGFTVLGFAIAGIKPQLSAPALLLIAWLEHRQRPAVLLGIGIWVGLSAFAIAVDPEFLHSYLSSMSHYRSAPENGLATGFGLVPLLLRGGVASGLAQIMGAATGLALVAVIGWFVRRSGKTLTSDPRALMLMVFSVAVVLPIHGYDLCCYAIGIALIATRTRSQQLALLVPAVIIWRPVLVHRPGPTAMPDLLPMLAWLSLLVSTSAMVIAGLLPGPKPILETAEGKKLQNQD